MKKTGKWLGIGLTLVLGAFIASALLFNLPVEAQNRLEWAGHMFFRPMNPQIRYDGGLFFQTKAAGTARFTIRTNGSLAINGSGPTCAAVAQCALTSGTDSGGVLTMGTTPVDNYVITFNTAWAAAPTCIVQQQTSAANYVTKVATTTTTFTVTSAAGPTAADKYSFICLGQQ